jgi:hypothetical protein
VQGKIGQIYSVCRYVAKVNIVWVVYRMYVDVRMCREKSGRFTVYADMLQR